ncbi:MAG: FecR domain-containing protein [Pseudomonadota bacterium]
MRQRIGASLVLLCVSVALGSGCAGAPPEDWVAKIVQVNGSVLTRHGSSKLQSAQKGDYLRAGARMETRANSHALLMLSDGGSLTIKAGSIVFFRSGHTQGKELNLKLEQGSVVSTGSKVEAGDLVIDVGAKRIRLKSRTTATIEAASSISADPLVLVEYGAAIVQGDKGAAKRILAGETLMLTMTDPTTTPLVSDGGGEDDQSIEQRGAFYLKPTGTGYVRIRRPNEQKFNNVLGRKVVEIPSGTQMDLGIGTTVLVGSKPGEGRTLHGPAQVTVSNGQSGVSDGTSTIALNDIDKLLRITAEGELGKQGTPFQVEGVTMVPRVVFERSEVAIRRGAGQSTLTVLAGEAVLKGQGKTLRLEAGQQAVLRRGEINGPIMQTASPLKLRSSGNIRVFLSEQVPITFRWDSKSGDKGHLVEVSPNRSMVRPWFSDVLQRGALTLKSPLVGSMFWRIRPQEAIGKFGKGVKGEIQLVPDTSNRFLKWKARPKNTIREVDGDTIVYYQNLLPDFTFLWRSIPRTKFYQLKIFREQKLTTPLVLVQSNTTQVELKAKLLEGRYLWYVVGRDSSGNLVRATKSQRLGIIYDNATPDLQIRYPPRQGITVSSPTVEVRGVTTNGSEVFINEEAVVLDATSRFWHQVQLVPGTNQILFRVKDSRGGMSYYFRRVTRK